MLTKLGKILLIFLLIVNLSVSITVVTVVSEMTISVGRLLGDIKSIVELYEIKKIINETLIEKSLLIMVDAIVQLKGELEDEIKNIRFDDIDKVNKATVILDNITAGFRVSGTHIKIDNKDYILTCAHTLETPKDTVMLRLDGSENYLPTVLEKANVEKDLAIFRVILPKEVPYLEVSNTYPQQGEEVYVSGNPGNIIDVITKGNIAKIYENNYLLTNIVMAGNSGGAVLYKGKIIGVVSQVRVFWIKTYFTNYAYTTNLNAVKEFLKDK